MIGKIGKDREEEEGEREGRRERRKGRVEGWDGCKRRGGEHRDVTDSLCTFIITV